MAFNSRYHWAIVPVVALFLALGFALSSPAIAATAPASDTSPGLESTVNEFLQNVPRGFYGVRDVAKIQAKVAESKTLFIDVREPSEYAGGHIRNDDVL